MGGGWLCGHEISGRPAKVAKAAKVAKVGLGLVLSLSTLAALATLAGGARIFEFLKGNHAAIRL
jgi:hypothetical protein